jgi:RNA polymerase sigma factor (sigma-70 family)
MSPGGLPRLPVVQSDQRLVALARGGDERAFETLVRRHRRPLIRYCRRMGLSDARAEDVLQQALLQAWLALERGSEVRAPKAWLNRTVHNTAVNVLRSSRDDHSPVDDRKRVDTSPSTESAFERRIAVRQTLSDVAALPQMQRDAILLTSIDGRSHAEIASALGVTHGAVRGLLYRARATLRDAAAVVAPQPALLWASGLLGRMAPTASRFAELSAPAGNADFGGVLAKGAALAATAAVLAVGTGIVPLSRHLAHRSKTAVLALGIAPSTAEASESSMTPGPSGALQERTSQAVPLRRSGSVDHSRAARGPRQRPTGGLRSAAMVSSAV